MAAETAKLAVTLCVLNVFLVPILFFLHVKAPTIPKEWQGRAADCSLVEVVLHRGQAPSGLLRGPGFRMLKPWLWALRRDLVSRLRRR